MNRKRQRRPAKGRRADLCLPASDRHTSTKRTTEGLHRDIRLGRYPDAPGAKGRDGTSQDAAAAIASRVPYMRRKALLALYQLAEAVSIEIAAASGHTREAILPRVSELRRMGLVEPTGARKLNPSGQTAAVLRLTGRGRAVAERFLHQKRRGGDA